jgi:hypothetical protein
VHAATAGVSLGTQGGSPEAFDTLKKAYAVLSDDDRRAVYDERLPPAIAVRPKVREHQIPAWRSSASSWDGAVTSGRARTTYKRTNPAVVDGAVQPASARACGLPTVTLRVS